MPLPPTPTTHHPCASLSHIPQPPAQIPLSLSLSPRTAPVVVTKTTHYLGNTRFVSSKMAAAGPGFHLHLIIRFTQSRPKCGNNSRRSRVRSRANVKIVCTCIRWRGKRFARSFKRRERCDMAPGVSVFDFVLERLSTRSRIYR